MFERALILGSSSPYRRELLQRLRLPFTTVAPDVDESALEHEAPAATALRLAGAKACAVAARYPDALIIASDQVADLDGVPLGKPGNHANAVRQLQTLSGKRAVFHTALCLLDAASGRAHSANVPTTVYFRELTDAQIDHYLLLESPYDCAGSAKIESLGVVLVQRIESDDPTALIGLPLMTLTTFLQRESVAVL
jgi:septum formation protein